MADPSGKVVSVNVGTAREFDYGGRPARSAIWESPWRRWARDLLHKAKGEPGRVGEPGCCE
jgi:hypothetical protein